MMNYPLIFLHLPKTAGTSLRRIIEKNYNSEELFFVYNKNPDFNSMTELRGFSDMDFRNYKIIMGHFPFNRKLFPFDDRRFVALVREPISRCISYYNHVMNRKEWQGRQISLPEYLEKTGDIQLTNHQTRLLAGMKQNPVTEKHLDSAIRNIEKHFLHVGTMDRFSQTIQNLGEMLGWKYRKIVRKNATPRKHDADNHISEDVLQLLHDHNEYDAKLYNYITTRLEQS